MHVVMSFMRNSGGPKELFAMFYLHANTLSGSQFDVADNDKPLEVRQFHSSEEAREQSVEKSTWRSMWSEGS
jgi:hypothetical protein